MYASEEPIYFSQESQRNNTGWLFSNVLLVAVMPGALQKKVLAKGRLASAGSCQVCEGTACLEAPQAPPWSPKEKPRPPHVTRAWTHIRNSLPRSSLLCPVLSYFLTSEEADSWNSQRGGCAWPGCSLSRAGGWPSFTKQLAAQLF